MTIVSSNYPDDYMNHARMEWLISGPEESQIVAIFHSFELESGYDFLTIGSGLNSSDHASHLVTLTGSVLPEDVVSTNNEMWLNFTSDYSVTRKGFWIEIMVFEQPNTTGKVSIHFSKVKSYFVCELCMYGCICNCLQSLFFFNLVWMNDILAFFLTVRRTLIIV